MDCRQPGAVQQGVGRRRGGERVGERLDDRGSGTGVGAGDDDPEDDRGGMRAHLDERLVDARACRHLPLGGAERAWWQRGHVAAQEELIAGLDGGVDAVGEWRQRGDRVVGRRRQVAEEGAMDGHRRLQIWAGRELPRVLGAAKVERRRKQAALAGVVAALGVDGSMRVVVERGRVHAAAPLAQARARGVHRCSRGEVGRAAEVAADGGARAPRGRRGHHAAEDARHAPRAAIGRRRRVVVGGLRIHASLYDDGAAG